MLSYDLYIQVDESHLSEYIFDLWKTKYPYVKRYTDDQKYAKNWWVLNDGYTLPFDLPEVVDDDLRFDNKFVDKHTLTLYARRPEGTKWTETKFRTVKKQHDAFFLQTGEINGQENYKQALKIFPHVHRVQGGSSIYKSHKLCSELALTENFFVIDADNWLLQNPNYYVPDWDKHYIHLWDSTNPNGLVYGHGGLKLFSKMHFSRTHLEYKDMTLTIGELKRHRRCMSEHRFNFSAFNTWRTAFREATKLKNNIDAESEQRLEVWLSNNEYAYGDYGVAGAVNALTHDIDINDQHKLLEHFLTWTRTQPTK